MKFETETKHIPTGTSEKLFRYTVKAKLRRVQFTDDSSFFEASFAVFVANPDDAVPAMAKLLDDVSADFQVAASELVKNVWLLT